MNAPSLDRIEHLEAIEAAAVRLVAAMDGYYPRHTQDALIELARLTGQLAPQPDSSVGGYQ